MKPHQHLFDALVPHWRNAHRPHLTRPGGLLVVAMLLLVIQVAGWLAVPAGARGATRGSVLGYATDINPVALLAGSNDERIKQGLPALKLDARLNQSAALKAANMFDEDYWAHVSPSGLQPWHWFSAAGYAYSFAGENLARDFATSSGVTAGWMASPGHRANILNANYADVGYAVVNGRLGGQETTLVVAHYGRVAGAAVASATATPTPASVVTPAPTPLPTPAPTPTAVPVVAAASPVATPTPTATPMPVAAPATVASPAFSLASFAGSVPWPVTASLFVLIIVLAVYVGAHLAAWRRRLPHWHQTPYHLITGTKMAVVLLGIGYFASFGVGRVG